MARFPTKSIFFILDELKENKLYLNRVFTVNTELEFISRYSPKLQAQLLQEKEEKDIKKIKLQIENAKTNFEFDKGLLSVLPELDL